MADGCCIESDYTRGRCCCNCRHHLRDHAHPETTGGSVKVQMGWICFPPEFDGAAFSGWTEHGMCEMHDFTLKDLEDAMREKIRRDYPNFNPEAA